MTIEITNAPIAVLVNNLMSPAPVSLVEAMGENKTRDHATDKRKKSAMVLMESVVTIRSELVLHQIDFLYIPLIRR